ncbi:hypothetical protein ABZ604_31540 [Streptomyces sp. NPDC012473]|uniref:hypothetical protein n=1 Tax=Streptomyces sp. NPDC012473 TaxID=3156676 RepID=UPI0033F556FF
MDSTVMPEMQILAAATATHLGPGWKGEPHPDNPRYMAAVTHEDGRRVHLRVDRYASSREAGRIHLSGQQPEPPTGIHVENSRIDFGHITVAATKTPRQIAADVSRRLLPALTAALATWQAKMDRLRAEEAERTTTASRLAQALGSTPTRANRGGAYEKRKLHLSWTGINHGRVPLQWTTTPRASVVVDADRSGEYVQIELSGLSAAQADRVLRALVNEEQRPAVPGN